MSYRFTFEMTLSLGSKEPDTADDECQSVPEPDDDCSICLERGGGGWVKLDCNHLFHRKCLLDYLRVAEHKRCPLCRHPIGSDDSCTIL